eukprot:s2146_g6.t1
MFSGHILSFAATHGRLTFQRQDIPASPPIEIPLVADRMGSHFSKWEPFRWADLASDSKPPLEFFDTPTSMGQQDLDGGAGFHACPVGTVKAVVLQFKGYYPEEAFIPAQNASKGPAPSMGSANHPNGCTECQFHFFSTAGCRMGADCRFCHLLHPRKCEKKNRKLMEENSKQHENTAVVPGGATILGAEEGVNVITFRYLKETNPRASGGRPPRVTFPIGAKLKLVPTIEFDRPEVDAVFTITPELPAGLAMNQATGIIVGVASEASPRDLYSIILCAPATSASGESLGLVPLAKCGMSWAAKIMRRGFMKAPKDRDDPCATQVGQIVPLLQPEAMPPMTAYDRQAGG